MGFLIKTILIVSALLAGQQAPSFSKPDIKGKPVNLESYRGKNVLLVLSRYIGCSYCQMFIVDLANHAEDLARVKAEVIIVTSSDAETAARYEPPRDFPFLLVPDPDMDIYKMYGVKMKARGFTWNVLKKSVMFVKYLAKYDWVKHGLSGPHLQPPACFVIDPAGVIRYSHIGRDIADNPDAEKLVKIIEELNKAH